MLGSSTSIDFSFSSWHSLLDFGKHSMEKSSAAAGVQALLALLPLPPVTALVPWVTHQHEERKQDRIRDGAKGTRYSLAEVTGQGCSTAKHKPHFFSGALHLSMGERTKSPSQRGQTLGWEEQSPHSITYLLISKFYLAPRYCNDWSSINTIDR